MLSMALLAVIVLGAFAGARLALGPVSIDAVAPEIERRINAELEGWRLRLGGADLIWDRARNEIGLSLRAAALTDPDGRPAANVGRATIRFDLGRAIRGDLRLLAAHLSDARATLVRTPEGLFRVAMSAQDGARDAGGDALDPIDAAEPSPTDPPPDPPGAAEDPGFGAAAQIVEGLTGDRGAFPALSEFRRVSFENFDISYDDQLGGAQWRVPSAALTLMRRDNGLEGAVTGVLEIPLHDPMAPGWFGDDQPSQSEGVRLVGLTLAGRRAQGAEAVELRASFVNADGAAMAGQLPALAPLAALEGALSGAASARLRLADGGLDALDVELSIDAAALRLPGRAPLRLGRAEAALSYDPGPDAVRLDRFEIHGETLSGALFGHADLIRGADGAPTSARGALRVGRLRIADPAVFAEPLEILGASLAFDASEQDRLTLSDMRIVARDATASGSAELALVQQDGVAAPVADFALAIEPFDAARLAALWPRMAAPGARAWVDANILGGRILDARFEGRFGPNEERLDATFRFEDLSASYLGDLPALIEGVGQGALSLERLDIAVESAAADLGAQGRLTLGGSAFRIPTFEPRIPPAEIEINGSGPLAGFLELIDRPPLGLVSKLDADLGDVAGRAEVAARLAFPLAKALRLEEIEVEAEADLRDAALIAPGLGRRVTARRGRLIANAERLDLSARAAAEGQPFDVRWRETFAPDPGASRTRLDLSTVATAERLRELGVPAGVARGGEGALSGRLRLFDGRPADFRLTLDAAGLDLAADPLGWAKPAGAEGRVVASGRADAANGILVDALEGALGALRFEGGAQLDLEGGVRALTLEPFAIDAPDGSTGTRLALSVDRRDDGGYSVVGRGASLDLSRRVSGGGAGTPADAPTGDARASETEGGADPDGVDTASVAPLDLDFQIDRVRMTDSSGVDGVSLQGARGADGAIELILNGFVDPGAAIAGTFRRDPEGLGAFRVSAPDAGGLLRAITGFEGARGGRLEVEGAWGADGVADGVVEIEDLVVTDAPILARILSVASLLAFLDELSSGGVRFAQITAPFRVSERSVSVRDAVATGASLGLTLAGRADRQTGALDFRGVVSPAYVINGLLNRLPVIGQILGGEGEGLVGVRYQVAGALDDPEVSVNPLSALTPGALRGIFAMGSRAPELDEAEEPAPAEAPSRRGLNLPKPGRD